MKVFNVLGVAVLLSLGSAALAAQNLVSPGQLAGQTNDNLTRSSFTSGGVASAVLPKNDIANVEDRHDRRVRTLWIASIFAMTAATTADAVSSWHKQETNGILASSNGTFGGKGVALKAGIAAGFLTPQIVFRKRKEWRTAFAIGNFAEAGIYTGAAVHNMNLK